MIWYGFDGVGNETRLIDEQVHADPTLGNLYRLEQRRRPGKPIRTLHAGRLRISTNRASGSEPGLARRRGHVLDPDEDGPDQRSAGRTMLTRRIPLRRRSRLRPVNRDRRQRDDPEVRGSAERRTFLRDEPCYVCAWLGLPALDPVEASHHPSVGAGGGKRDQFPCCFHHHRGDDGSHALGVQRFERRFEVRLKDLTARFDSRYEESRAGSPLSPVLTPVS